MVSRAGNTGKLIRFDRGSRLINIITLPLQGSHTPPQPPTSDVFPSLYHRGFSPVRSGTHKLSQKAHRQKTESRQSTRPLPISPLHSTVTVQYLTCRSVVFKHTEGGGGPPFNAQPTDQISIKTPNPKCRLFLKIDQ
jgi:hypothetical protein